jgi:hypothetical protein
MYVWAGEGLGKDQPKLQRTFTATEENTVQDLIKKSIRDENELADRVFYARHPRLRKGRPLNRALQAEWDSILNGLVRPQVGNIRVISIFVTNDGKGSFKALRSTDVAIAMKMFGADGLLWPRGFAQDMAFLQTSTGNVIRSPLVSGALQKTLQLVFYVQIRGTNFLLFANFDISSCGTLRVTVHAETIRREKFVDAPDNDTAKQSVLTALPTDEYARSWVESSTRTEVPGRFRVIWRTLTRMRIVSPPPLHVTSSSRLAP